MLSMWASVFLPRLFGDESAVDVLENVTLPQFCCREVSERSKKTESM